LDNKIPPAKKATKIAGRKTTAKKTAGGCPVKIPARRLPVGKISFFYEKFFGLHNYTRKMFFAQDLFSSPANFFTIDYFF
jgi:hypothetical protein